MEEITKTYFIETSVEKVWKALTDSQEIAAWGADPAEMNAEVGFEFSLWGGDIHGTNLEVVKNERLVQEWYGGNWDHPSKVTMELEVKDHGTEVNMLQEDVPEEELDKLDAGWDEEYFGPMKEYLEAREQKIIEDVVEPTVESSTEETSLEEI